MRPVTVYTRPLCGYCARALALLEKKGAQITEICAAFDEEKRKEMIQRSGGRITYPQIFIGDRHIGGCDELVALEREGKLDDYLNAA
ncbi:MAG: glutaredoxin 3 [Alphaproteobacteria bacterium]|nr:glutaredoxin 3 [Alphaproteobacteria bacterium]